MSCFIHSYLHAKNQAGFRSNPRCCPPLEDYAFCSRFTLKNCTRTRSVSPCRTIIFSYWSFFPARRFALLIGHVCFYLSPPWDLSLPTNIIKKKKKKKTFVPLPVGATKRTHVYMYVQHVRVHLEETACTFPLL